VQGVNRRLSILEVAGSGAIGVPPIGPLTNVVYELSSELQPVIEHFLPSCYFADALRGGREMFRYVLLAALCAVGALLSTSALADGTLIISPHPDDDILTAAGVAVRARQAGENVTVVYMTNGDLSGGTASGAGTTRQNEAVKAQTYLGALESQLIFLGYPDGGLVTIYTSYTSPTSVFLAPQGTSATYASRGLGGVDYHAYRFGQHAAYNLPNMVADLADIIGSRRPTQIFTTAEFDLHNDHSTTYRVLRLALAPILSADPSYHPVVNKTIVWSANTGIWPGPPAPSTYLSPIPSLDASMPWANRESLDVPLSMQTTVLTDNQKYNAIFMHASQTPSVFLSGFAHKDEVFWAEDPRAVTVPPIVSAGTDFPTSASQITYLNGGSSVSPSGRLLTYGWRQSAGTPVTISSSDTATPYFTAPSTNQTLVFELRLADGVFTTTPDAVSVIVGNGSPPPPPPPPSGTNIAPTATVTASSETAADGQTAAKAVDGVIDGYPGDYTREWATQGQKAGAWINLAFKQTYTVDHVTLFDRPNSVDQVTSGRLTFSDGSTVAVGPLDNAGGATTVSFTARSTSSVRFDVLSTSAGTHNIGLAEIQIFSSGSGTTQPPVANAGVAQTVSAGALVMLDGTHSSDPQSLPLTYAWTQTGGPSVALVNPTSASPTFTAPSSLSADATLTFQLVVSDGIKSSAPATVVITVTAIAPSGTNIAPTATVTASSQNSGTGQNAVKAVDGVIDGYPGDYTREWATLGQKAGAWLNLVFPRAYIVDHVTLYDRRNANDQILSATLTFSDGTVVQTGPLDNAGGATTVTFTARSTSSVRLDVTSVSAATVNIGLEEIQVFGR
jgi:LmbE family N-acetylglucosaminyl deacetylase